MVKSLNSLRQVMPLLTSQGRKVSSQLAEKLSTIKKDNEEVSPAFQVQKPNIRWRHIPHQAPVYAIFHTKESKVDLQPTFVCLLFLFMSLVNKIGRAHV